MMCQRAKNVFEQLPDQYDMSSFARRSDDLFHGPLPQLRLQHVVEILFAEQVQAVAAHASE